MQIPKLAFGTTNIEFGVCDLPPEGWQNICAPILDARRFLMSRMSRIWLQLLFFEPSGGKSHALDSILEVPMANSRILAIIYFFTASSCLGGNHEMKSIGGLGRLGAGWKR